MRRCCQYHELGGDERHGCGGDAKPSAAPRPRPPIKLRALATRVLELAVPPAVASPWPTSSLDEAAALLAHASLDLQKQHRAVRAELETFKRHSRWRCPPSSWLFPGRTHRLWRLIRPLRSHVVTVQAAAVAIEHWRKAAAPRTRRAPRAEAPRAEAPRAEAPLLTGPCPFGSPHGVPGPPILSHWSALEPLRSLAWNMRCDPSGCVVCAPYQSEAPSRRQRGHLAYELGLGALRVLRDPQCRHDPTDTPRPTDITDKPRLLLAAASEDA